MNIQSVPRQRILAGPVKVVYQPGIIRGLCKHPYYKHSGGCPNFGKRVDCPPKADLFRDCYEEEAYILAIKFDFERYLELRRREHPDWTERALRNPRHWQNHLRCEISTFHETAKELLPELVVITNPEAMGVNLTETCALLGLTLEWPPVRSVFQINLLAKLKD